MGLLMREMGIPIQFIWVCYPRETKNPPQIGRVFKYEATTGRLGADYTFANSVFHQLCSGVHIEFTHDIFTVAGDSFGADD